MTSQITWKEDRRMEGIVSTLNLSLRKATKQRSAMQCNLETQKRHERITDDSFMGQVGEKRPPVTETRVS